LEELDSVKHKVQSTMYYEIIIPFDLHLILSFLW